MNSLDLLADSGIVSNNGFPLMNPNDYKKSKAVIFQKYCQNGAHYDVMISWMQKAVRRNLLVQALYCVTSLVSMEGIFLSHTLNRLVVMLSEDIGVAECGLAKLVYTSYTAIWSRRKINGDLCAANKKAFLNVIKEYATARHSRYVDYLIHWYEAGKIIASKTSVAAFRNYLKKGDVEQAAAIVIKIHESREQLPAGSCKKSGKRKRLKIFLYWDVLLEYKKNEDVFYLFKLYEIRKSLLQLVHAVGIVSFKTIGRPDRTFQGVKNSWDCYQNKHMPLLNAAVDRHTYAGRSKLGRGTFTFLTEGAKLANESLIGKELAYRNYFIEYYREVEGYNRFKPLKARAYQKKIVGQCTKHFEENKNGRLEIACGAGKTYTTYLIKKALETKLAVKNVLILVPRLLILNSYYECWRDQIIAEKKGKYRIGVVASDIANTVKSDYCCHLDLQTAGEIKDYLNNYSPCIIFATYASAGKVLEAADGYSFDLSICDEAHHCGEGFVESLSVISKKILFQTATETHELIKNIDVYGKQIAAYNFRSAIDDGYLVDYTVELVEGSDHSSLVNEINLATIKSNKMIVFSRNNSLSYQLYESFRDACGSNITPIYVDCTIKMAERQMLLDSFRKCDKAVIFNCSILGEGVDLPECDGVLFTYPKTSFVDTVQSFGRCLRVDPENEDKKAYIKMVYSNEMQKINYKLMLARIGRVDPEVWDSLVVDQK